MLAQLQETDFRAPSVPAPLPEGSEYAAPPSVAAILDPLFAQARGQGRDGVRRGRATR